MTGDRILVVDDEADSLYLSKSARFRTRPLMQRRREELAIMLARKLVLQIEF